jgi:hypothetical protein
MAYYSDSFTFLTQLLGSDSVIDMGVLYLKCKAKTYLKENFPLHLMLLFRKYYILKKERLMKKSKVAACCCMF